MIGLYKLKYPMLTFTPHKKQKLILKILTKINWFKVWLMRDYANALKDSSSETPCLR